MRNAHALWIGLALTLTLQVGCQKEPAHDVEMSPDHAIAPPPPIDSPPRLDEVRPLVDTPDEPTAADVPKARPLTRVEAPLAVDPPVASPPVGEAMESYTIQPGDTLWKIAKTKLDNGKRWKDIAKANPGLEPTKLRPGQVILIPAR